jgi:hypothetical protein
MKSKFDDTANLTHQVCDYAKVGKTVEIESHRKIARDSES